MKPLVSIIIVSHDHKEFLKTCLVSVLNQQGVSFDVILVDNASKDGTADVVRQTFPSVNLIQRSKRFGFASNVNEGIKKSQGMYVLVLNPDTQMQKGSLKTLVHRMESDNNIGIVGAKLVNPDGTLQLSFRNFPTWKTALFRRTPLRVFFPNNIVTKQHLNVAKNHDKAQRVDWMLGACLLIRRHTLDKIGLLDEKYRLYVEDIDICLKAHKAGWSVWYEPGAIVEHKHEAKSDKQLLSIYSYFHASSMVYFIYKFWIKEFFWSTARVIRKQKKEAEYFFRKLLYCRREGVVLAQCPICGWKGTSFRDFDCGLGNIYKNAECPVCGSHPRHRLVYVYLRRTLTREKFTRILHFAPEAPLIRCLLSWSGKAYVSVDIDPKRAMHQENIEELSFPDESFDLMLCLCVLEHVRDDKKAMQEMYRVLSRKGMCIVDSPIDYSRKTTLEDPAIQSSKERARAYWQEDHVRLYGRDFVLKLAVVGFSVTPLRGNALVGISKAKLFGFLNHTVYIAIK